MAAPQPKLKADDRSELFNEEFLKKLEYLHVVSRKVFAGRIKAERKTKKTGSGIEFADHRKYYQGDDVRYIDWNLYGRIDKLLHEVPRAQRVVDREAVLPTGAQHDDGIVSKHFVKVSEAKENNAIGMGVLRGRMLLHDGRNFCGHELLP